MFLVLIVGNPIAFFALILIKPHLPVVRKYFARSLDIACFTDFHQALTDQAHDFIYLFFFFFPVNNVTQFGFVTNLNRGLSVSWLFPIFIVKVVELLWKLGRSSTIFLKNYMHI